MSKRFEKLYAFPCHKTLQCEYIKKTFVEKPIQRYTIFHHTFKPTSVGKYFILNKFGIKGDMIIIMSHSNIPKSWKKKGMRDEKEKFDAKMKMSCCHSRMKPLIWHGKKYIPQCLWFQHNLSWGIHGALSYQVVAPYFHFEPQVTWLGHIRGPNTPCWSPLLLLWGPKLSNSDTILLLWAPRCWVGAYTGP